MVERQRLLAPLERAAVARDDLASVGPVLAEEAYELDVEERLVVGEEIWPRLDLVQLALALAEHRQLRLRREQR